MRKGLDLGEVERQIRIPRRYLQALEEDRFGALPAPVYARGFLRNYARFLGLDENEIVLGLDLGNPQPSVLPVIAPRSNSNLWTVAITAFGIGLVLWAILGLKVFNLADDLVSDITGGDSEAPIPIIVTTTPAPTCDQLLQRASLSDEERAFLEENCATPTPVPPTPVPYRTSCDAIRGTEYQSPDERTYFLENCLTPPPG